MTYNKPTLQGYSAIVAIQNLGNNKTDDPMEPGIPGSLTDPAYQADE